MRTPNNNRQSVDSPDYRALFRNAPVGVYIAAPLERFLSANPALANMLGYSSEHELIHAMADISKQIYSRYEERDELKRLVAGQGKVVDYECLWLKRDGTPIWVSNSVYAVQDEHGHFLYQGYVMDISERKRTERELQESEERFKAIVDGAPDAVFVQTEKRFAYLNPKAVKLFGALDASDLLGQPVFDRFHPDFHDQVLERIRRLNEMRQPVTDKLEQKYLRLDGSEVWVETTALPVTYQGKQGALVFVRDITERIQAEEILRQSENYYRTVFETSGAATIIINEDTTISLANSDFEAMSGYSQEEIEGRKSWTDFIHPEDVEQMLEYHYLRRREPDAAPRQYEHRFLDRTGREHCILISVDLIRGTEQSVASFVDITERKHSEEKIRHLNQVLTAIRNVNQLITQERDRERLIREACNRLVEARGYDAAWAALLDDSGACYMCAEAGLGQDFLPMRERLQKGELPTCAREVLDCRDVVVMRDTFFSCGDCPLAGEFPGSARIAAPLSHQGVDYGVVALSIPKLYAEEEQEQDLVRELAEDIAFALYSIGQEEHRIRAEEELQDSERFLRSTLDGMPAHIAVLDQQGEIVLVNQAWRDFAERSETPAESVSEGVNYLAVCSKATGESAREAKDFARGIKQVITGEQEIFSLEYPCHDQERERWFEGRVTPFGGSASRRAVVSHWDITEHRQAEQRLQTAHDKLDKVVQLNADGLMVLNQEGYILFLNPAAVAMLGHDQSELLGAQFGHPIIPGSSIEIELLSPTGEVRVAELRARETEWSGQTALLVSFRDITERKQAEERIYHLAYYDELTDLPNRRLFYDRLKQITAGSGHFGEGGAVFLTDITRLRDVNDTLGQEAGDELIREVARRIVDAAGEKDTVARDSGGGFMVLSEESSTAEKARNLGLRILERIGERLELSGRQVYPAVNMGFTLFPDWGTDPDTLIKQADLALSQAKKSVQGIQDFAGQDDWIARMFHLEHDLKQALVNEEFFLCYQPQIDLRTGRIEGLEALLRWKHPQRGVVSPGEFIPVLEQTGMIASADAWVIHRVCKQLRSWQESGVLVRASVNLSVQELNEDTIIEVFKAALEENDVHPENLVVEITETALMENVDRASWILQTLSSWGVGVALDDFGKGYSSLSYLQQLAINTIKIDKQFVDGLPGDKDTETLVQTIINMAHNLGKQVLAEGVEREDQRKILEEMGCDYAQGFLFSRPIPPEEMILILSASNP